MKLWIGVTISIRDNEMEHLGCDVGILHWLFPYYAIGKVVKEKGDDAICVSFVRYFRLKDNK